jgi:hypothetical protein
LAAGLHQYDGLTSFFGNQAFDYNGFVLPQVLPAAAHSCMHAFWRTFT